MSDSGRNNLGRPDAMVEAGYLRFIYCGGSGGGDCIDALGVVGVVLTYRLQKFIVYNKRIIFENKEFFGVQIFTDGGPVAFCSHSAGVEVPCYMALSIDGNLTNQEIVQRGKVLTGAPPYEIEFAAKDIPQPNEELWADHLFVHLYWGSAAYVNGASGALPTENSFRIAKHDYDVKL